MTGRSAFCYTHKEHEDIYYELTLHESTCNYYYMIKINAVHKIYLAAMPVICKMCG